MNWRTPQPAQPQLVVLPGLPTTTGVDRVRHVIASVTEKPDVALLQQMCQEHFYEPGKMVRARLALAVGEAYDLDRDWLAPWGAAVELVHNATLVHDDIQDGDEVRRGQATTWVVHGENQAINLGDHLLMAATQAIDFVDCSPERKWYLSRCLSRRSCATVGGQVLDLSLSPESEWSWDAYLRVVTGKTGHLLALPVEGALILAGFSPDEAQHVADLFLDVGVLYQLQDDVLDIFGDKQRDVSACDLYEGKVSALVIADSILHPEHIPEMKQLLCTPREDTDRLMVDKTVTRFKEEGALDAVLERMHSLRNSFLSQQWGQMNTVAQDLMRAIQKPIGEVWR